MCKGSWSYGNNKIITDTGCGNIHLAGAVIEVMGIKSAMTIRITTPTTSSGGGTTNAQFTYINHGTGYSPGWRRDYNSRNKPTACVAGRLRASPPVVVPYCLRNRMALNRIPTAPAHPVRIWGRKPHRRLITALNPRITLVRIPIVLAVRLLQPVHIPIR